MADFTPPFANAGERRVPTPDELANGFPCGPADQALFNWLHWAAQAEIGNVIEFAAITPDAADVTTLRRAIQALIAAALGGGPAPDYLTLAQAKARLPFYPDVTTTDGKIVVTSTGAANVRVSAGSPFQHRGIYPVVTVQTDLVTVANKVYHLRWDGITETWSLKDLAAPAYNPGALPETNAAFDSTYDDMLAAYVSTNGSNIPTIIPLVNKIRLRRTEIITGVPVGLNGQNGATFNVPSSVYNWARTPTGVIFAPRTWSLQSTLIGGIAYVQDLDISVAPGTTRYQTVANPVVIDYATGCSFNALLEG